MLVSFSITLLSQQNTFAKPAIVRIAGQDRYATAVQVSDSGWNTAKNIILVNGNNFPDALSAAPLAKQLDAPILLSEKDYLSDAITNKIKGLQPDDIYIIGGTGSISENVVNILDSLGNIRLHRIYGQDRYSTSTAVADYILTNFSTSDTIFVTNGEGYADALSVAPIAAQKGIPVLLSQKDGFTDATKQFLNKNNIKKAYVVGGTGVISDSILSNFSDPQRIWGVDRYETNINVIDYFKSSIDSNSMFISSGENFPDALASSALVAKQSSILLLMPKTPSLHIKQFLTSFIDSDNSPKVNTLYIIGGTGAISNQTLQDLTTPTNSEGMAFENFEGGGDVTAQGDTIYYAVKKNSSTLTGAIYKMKDDKSNKVKIIDTDGIPYDINIVGDWIYYIDQTIYTHTSVGGYTDSYYYFTLYRVKTDGTNNMKLSDDDATQMMVIGDSIYYSVSSHDKHNSKLGIYKMNLDGTNKNQLFDYEGASENIVNYTDKYIFYTGSWTDDNTYRMNLDGSNKTKLVDAEFIVYGTSDWIYSLAGDFYMNNVMYREKADGTEKSTIYDGDPFTTNHPIILGNNIYFTRNDGIYRMNTDGTEITRIYVTSTRGLSIVGNHIYFRDISQSNDVIKRINLDGSNEETIQD